MNRLLEAVLAAADHAWVLSGPRDTSIDNLNPTIQSADEHAAMLFVGYMKSCGYDIVSSGDYNDMVANDRDMVSRIKALRNQVVQMKNKLWTQAYMTALGAYLPASSEYAGGAHSYACEVANRLCGFQKDAPPPWR
jgi:hypothetical protein